MTRSLIAFLWATFGFLGSGAIFLTSIFRSTSSTAGIGILFIPFYAAPFAVLFFIFGYCLPDLVQRLKGKTTELSNFHEVRAVIAIIILSGSISYLIYGILLTFTVNQVQTSNESELTQFLDHSWFRNNKYALGALAQNPNVLNADLDRVARMPNPELHQRMWSIWPVMEGNGKGLAVMRLIARNTNVSEATLVHLSKSPDNYVIGAVAGNPKTPITIIRELFEKGDYLAQWGLARNPKSPVDILEKLADSRNEYTRTSIARNVGTPIITLMQLAKDSVWHVRRAVVSNPQTPVGTIESLANDSDRRVRSGVENRLSGK